MAKGVINLQKESGGVTKITSTDGIGITELVLPESGELVNKDYADLKVALSDLTGTNVSLSGNGYQKLPSGLIIQWGTTNGSTTSTGYRTFPIAFPNECLVGCVSYGNFDASGMGSAFVLVDKSQFLVTHRGGSGTLLNAPVRWIAIGY